MMAEFFYSMVGWGAAFCSWISEPVDPKKRRQAEALRAMRAELYGKPRLVQGGKR